MNNNGFYFPVSLDIPLKPLGFPMGVPRASYIGIKPQNRSLPPLVLPGANLPRAINYLADYGGCGAWRQAFPAMMLNFKQKAIIMDLTIMLTDPRIYETVKSVRLQRQATPHQLNFVKFLKEIGKRNNVSIIYEIDDIVFREDIPDYNRCKTAFDDPSILESIKEMMSMSDEISVTCDFMKQYYINKTGNKHVTVIPNYPPRMWFDRYYDETRLDMNYEKHKKRPKVAYFGSGTHIDVQNKTNQIDDFSHVVKDIIKSRKDIEWVFCGAFPLPVKPFIDNGEMTYIDWAILPEYPKKISEVLPNLTFAPLLNNVFNCAKSEIKFLESACLGIPCITQNLVTYKNSFVKFNTGTELIDQIKSVMKDKSTYMKLCKKSRSYADQNFLDGHLDEHYALYFTKWGSKERNKIAPHLIKNNPDQKFN